MTVRQEFDPLRALLRALPLVLAVALVGGLVLGTLYRGREPEYTSSTRVLFDVSGGPQSAVRSGQGLSGPDAERALNTQVDVVTSDEVLRRVQATTAVTSTQVRRSTVVTRAEGSNTLTILATAASRERARELAGGLADAYAAANTAAGKQSLQAQADALDDAVEELGDALSRATGESAAASATRGALQSQLVALAQQQQQLRGAAASYSGQVTVLSAATLPEGPSSPGARRGAAEGAALGGLLGAVLALLLEARRVRRSPEPAVTGARRSRREDEAAA